MSDYHFLQRQTSANYLRNCLFQELGQSDRGRFEISKVSATAVQEKILGPDELKNLCKQGVLLVNTARGGLIDEAALQDCLKNGKVSFACLDVFEDEPYCGPLCSLENVILTPHIGGSTLEAQENIAEEVAEKLVAVLRQVTTTTSGGYLSDR